MKSGVVQFGRCYKVRGYECEKTATVTLFYLVWLIFDYLAVSEDESLALLHKNDTQ